MLEVIAKGPLATVQDRGRPGYAHLGVPRSGALDPPALDRANRLAGNPVTAAGLELSFGRFSAVFYADALIAITGAVAPVTVDGNTAASVTWVKQGQTLEIGGPSSGVHCYLAVRGGIDVPLVLGSRSTDTLSGLGHPPLRVGDQLAFGVGGAMPEGVGGARPEGVGGAMPSVGGAMPSVGGVVPSVGGVVPSGGGVVPSVGGVVPGSVGVGDPMPEMPGAEYGDEIRVRVRFGPREDWFRSAEELTWNQYQMGMANRIGARLRGPALERSVAGELPSEGLVAGAVQVPGDGRPIVFLADHPTTGGYPVIAVVHPADLPLVAQARPGTNVVFCGP